ncbi:cell division protein FtsX [Rhizosaccharibacter radicis]|uniref:FtsX-like permease family protein n=1 Tax=Rhizosaccharibacter radicis TaxID=2782605 RepID=A0ABT1VYE5_9PROT|nr:hypothetical protein [Acetobacteraceae bacterium KSS12]
MAEAAASRRRPRDGLGLRRAISDRLLPALVAAMTFLAALTLAGVVGATVLATRWQQGAATILTVQVPRPDDPAGPGEAEPGAIGLGTSANGVAAAGSTRIAAVTALLRASPAVIRLRRLENRELVALLRPWLGGMAESGARAGSAGDGSGTAASNGPMGADRHDGTPPAGAGQGPAARSEADADAAGIGLHGTPESAAGHGHEAGDLTANRAGDGEGGAGSDPRRAETGDTTIAGFALPLPAVLQLRLRDAHTPLGDLPRRLAAVAPETAVEQNGDWSDRLLSLAQSLQACAVLALLVVAGVAAAVVAAATRAGLSARREAIEIVHGLGATDGYIAGRFAERAGVLALGGGIAGTALSLPPLFVLCRLAAPFAGGGPAAPGVIHPALAPADTLGGTVAALFATLPLALWIALPLLPLIASVIGWLTAQATVRTWLRRLP